MIAPNWDQPKCPIRSKWINKYVEYYYYNKKEQRNAKDNNLDESQNYSNGKEFTCNVGD